MVHNFNTDLAKEVGMTGAVLLYHIDFWVTTNAHNKSNFHDGRYWTYNSIDAFAKQFPYLSAKQIRYALDNLTGRGLLLKGDFSEDRFARPNWYTLSEGYYQLMGTYSITTDLAKQDAQIGNTTCQNWQHEMTDLATLNNTNIVHTDNPSKGVKEKVEEDAEFLKFWELYDKKVSKDKTLKLWAKLKKIEKERVFEVLPKYVKSRPDKNFRRNPDTWLRNRGWEDEIITKKNIDDDKNRPFKPTLKPNDPRGYSTLSDEF